MCVVTNVVKTNLLIVYTDDNHSNVNQQLQTTSFNPATDLYLVQTRIKNITGFIVVLYWNVTVSVVDGIVDHRELPLI